MLRSNVLIQLYMWYHSTSKDPESLQLELPAFGFFYSCDFDEFIATAKNICEPNVPNDFLCMPHTSTIFWHEISSKLVDRFPTHFILGQSDEPSLLRKKCWNNAPKLFVVWWGFPWYPCRIARLRRQQNGGSWPLSEGNRMEGHGLSQKVHHQLMRTTVLRSVSTVLRSVSTVPRSVSCLRGSSKILEHLLACFFFPVHCAKVKRV